MKDLGSFLLKLNPPRFWCLPLPLECIAVSEMEIPNVGLDFTLQTSQRDVNVRVQITLESYTSGEDEHHVVSAWWSDDFTLLLGGDALHRLALFNQFKCTWDLIVRACEKSRGKDKADYHCKVDRFVIQYQQDRVLKACDNRSIGKAASEYLLGSFELM